MNFIPSSEYRGAYHYEQHGPLGPGYYLLDMYRTNQAVPQQNQREHEQQQAHHLFYPSPYFRGGYQGYVFTTGHHGTGYYMDTRYARYRTRHHHS